MNYKLDFHSKSQSHREQKLKLLIFTVTYPKIRLRFCVVVQNLNKLTHTLLIVMGL